LVLSLLLAILIKLLKSSKSATDKKDALVDLLAYEFNNENILPYLQVLHEPLENANHLSERQATAILELRLHRLNSYGAKKRSKMNLRRLLTTSKIISTF